jgi:tRNA nucleotidyltransferase/poly(A) polymerase
MPLSRDIITQTLETPTGRRAYGIVETLTDAKHDAWWVGGAVRDMLEGKIPKDIDIATDAKPERVCELFHRSRDASDGLGSVRIAAGNEEFEVTTFREDDEASDGRHPEAVVFGSREQDAARRDFTVNAMYWHPISHELFDPYSGEADLGEKLIRFIGEPAVRIKHDALRILRAVRFRALLDGQYHPETYRALQEQAQLVEILSGMRVRTELEKMLRNPHPDRAFEDLWELGILQFILPELHACKGIPQPADYHREGDVWDHTLQCIRNLEPEDGPDVRLAILFHDCGKAQTFSLKERIRFDHHASISADLASRALERLEISKDRRLKIDWLVRHHMSMIFTELSDERKAHWYFHPWFGELLRIFRLDIAGTDPADYQLYDAILKDYHTFLDRHPRPEKPLLSGTDVMQLLGVPSGEEVGRLLQALHEAQVTGGIRSKAEAREFLIKKHAKKNGRG